MRRTLRYALFVVPLVLVGAAFATRDQWDWMLEDGAAEDRRRLRTRRSRTSTSPPSACTGSRATTAPRSPTRVEEILAGASKTAEGTTTAVAGDIAVNTDDPSASRVGTIVVNVEQFESDSALRDKRIRTDFLNSSDHPMAEFARRRSRALPPASTARPGPTWSSRGDLTVGSETRSGHVPGNATLTEDALEATLTGTVLMSDFDVGPINVAGLVKTERRGGARLRPGGRAHRSRRTAPPGGAVLAVDSPEIPEGEFAGPSSPSSSPGARPATPGPERVPTRSSWTPPGTSPRSRTRSSWSPGRIHATVAGGRHERADEARLLDQRPTRWRLWPPGPTPAAASTSRPTRPWSGGAAGQTRSSATS